jgi:hypothetical protein
MLVKIDAGELISIREPCCTRWILERMPRVRARRERSEDPSRHNSVRLLTQCTNANSVDTFDARSTC